MKKLKKMLSSPDVSKFRGRSRKGSDRGSEQAAAERWANRESDFEDYEICLENNRKSTHSTARGSRGSAGEAVLSEAVTNYDQSCSSNPGDVHSSRSGASASRAIDDLREDNAFPSDLSAHAERKASVPFDLSRVSEEEEEDEAKRGSESDEDLYGVSDDELRPGKPQRRSVQWAVQPSTPRKLQSPFQLSRNNSRGTVSTTSLPSNTRSPGCSRPALRRQLTDSPSAMSRHSRSSFRNSSELQSPSQTVSRSPPPSPGYIHRVQSPTGTRYSLQTRSPSESRTRVTLEWAEGSSLTLKSTVEEISRQHAWKEEKQRRRALQRSNADGTGATPPGNRSDSSLSQASAASPSPRWGHKRAGHTALRGDQLANQVGITNPNNWEATGLAFQSSRDNVRSKKGKELVDQRKPTVAPSSSLQPSEGQDNMTASERASQVKYKTADGEDPPRPSFEPNVFTDEELQAYAKMRQCYAAAVVLEKAVVPLINVYNGIDWPEGLKPPVNAETHSSLQWARQATALFRHEIKNDELYLRFQRNGNDIATRAKNDVIKTGGSLPEIMERIENWTRVDREEKVQVIGLMGVNEKGDVKGNEGKASDGKGTDQVRDGSISGPSTPGKRT